MKVNSAPLPILSLRTSLWSSSSEDTHENCAPHSSEGEDEFEKPEEHATLREPLLELQEELVNPTFEWWASGHYHSGKFVHKARKATLNFARWT